MTRLTAPQPIKTAGVRNTRGKASTRGFNACTPSQSNTAKTTNTHQGVPWRKRKIATIGHLSDCRNQKYLATLRRRLAACGKLPKSERRQPGLAVTIAPTVHCFDR